ncbi:MAG TPA: hypothetical protein VK922_03490 [Gemmatimonadaceae bacterium]|nr:hypothetical protein [Gemmatimonadaceae bacterium]
MAPRIDHQEVVKAVLDSKAVDFGAVGKLMGQMGPTLALSDEPWESFCGTMRMFIRIFILSPGFPSGGPLGDLSQLRELSGELKGGMR